MSVFIRFCSGNLISFHLVCWHKFETLQICVMFTFKNTRMHSSRMRTTRSLTASRSIGGVACVGGGACMAGEHTGQGDAWQGEGACMTGGMRGRGVCVAGRLACMVGRGCAWWGCAWQGHAWHACPLPPLWIEFLMHACENFTFP